MKADSTAVALKSKWTQRCDAMLQRDIVLQHCGTALQCSVAMQRCITTLQSNIAAQRSSKALKPDLSVSAGQALLERSISVNATLRCNAAERHCSATFQQSVEAGSVRQRWTSAP